MSCFRPCCVTKVILNHVATESTHIVLVMFLGHYLRLVLTLFPSSKALKPGSGLQTWSDQRDDLCNWDNTPRSSLTNQHARSAYCNWDNVKSNSTTEPALNYRNLQPCISMWVVGTTKYSSWDASCVSLVGSQCRNFYSQAVGCSCSQIKAMTFTIGTIPAVLVY